ncbi:MAG TPA: M14 metallopeptidase family protein [Myxococcaceae bacterium]|nr:M14 metallopeptidase family protein [Myxococcaceae bacterium]
MRRNHRSILATAILLSTSAIAAAGPEAGRGKPLSPSEFVGFEVGADRRLADYRQIVSYFRALAAASGRIQVENLGQTTLGNELILAAISSEQNLRDVKKYQDIARRLADPRGLSPAQIEGLVNEGKLIVLVTCNIHSTEIGASQMAMEWAHALVTANDPETRRRLDNVILLLVPSLNPDGQIMETEWYRKNLGTKFEGGRLPWLYHHYVGHDDNRDWFMLTQKETRALNRAVYFEWFPQVWLDEHQMGSSGPRIFVPPYADPVAKSINPLIWRGVNLIGTTMAWRLEEQKKPGVIYGFSYDAYWPGGTKNTAWWKNVYGLLTEVASARMATPIEISPTELSGGRKGLIEYHQQTNFPNPWPGGRWRLRDIMDYERIVSDALLETCTDHRRDFLRGSVAMALDAIKAGKPEEYYRIKTEQRDPPTAARLAQLMREHGVQVQTTADGRAYVINTAQPYGRFVSEMLGTQRYPKVKATAGPSIITPYDVAAWSLPLMMGVEVEVASLSADERKNLRALSESDWPAGRLEGSGPVYALSHDANNASRLINAAIKAKRAVSVVQAEFSSDGVRYPAGTLLVEPGAELTSLAAKYHLKLQRLSQKPAVASAKLREVRVGLYKPWLASMDEGWTRWLLEQYEFNLKTVDNKAVKAGKLNASFDVLILPDAQKEAIVEGKPKREEDAMKYFTEFPPEYANGIGKEGTKNLKDFVDNGGTLIALAQSGELLIDEFNIPVRNVLAKAKPEAFSCPGSLLRIEVDPNHPVTYGMPVEAAAFVNEPIAYQTALPGEEMRRAVLAWYPEDSEDVLLSGWIHGSEKLVRHAAAVALTYGKGKLVLFGFRVQHRAQTEGTFKLLFNAIHWGGMG